MCKPQGGGTLIIYWGVTSTQNNPWHRSLWQMPAEIASAWLSLTPLLENKVFAIRVISIALQKQISMCGSKYWIYNRTMMSDIIFIFYLFLYFLLFSATSAAYGGSQARGSNWSCNCQPMSELQQRQIWAASASYITAHGNTRSLTHWARPGIEPVTSSFLVRFVSAAPQRELLSHF